MSKQILILSWHEKGFPMADDYDDEWTQPDGYKTGVVGESMQTFRNRCKQIWPDVPMMENDDA